jgi:hypothetical protein
MTDYSPMTDWVMHVFAVTGIIAIVGLCLVMWWQSPDE